MTTTQTLTALATAIASEEIKVVDLSGTLGPDTPLIKLPPEVAINTPKVEIHEISKYDDNGPFWSWNWLKLGEHSGTHFDAPIHWISGRDYADGSTDTIPPQNFIAPACVIDFSVEAKADPDYLLTADRVKEWETKHGDIPARSWVLMRTDWYKRGHSEELFLNADENGSHAPGPATDCIQYLIEKDILGWGSEAVGTDAGQGFGLEPPLPAHHLMHEANRYGLASLCNLDQLPATGSVIITPPLKILNGTGSPIRVLALISAT